MEGFIDFVVVFVLTLLAGGWSTGAGVLMGMEPIVVYIAAVSGAVAYTAVVLFAAGPWRDRMFERHFPDMQERIGTSRIGTIIERWGEVGLAVSSIVVGPSLALAAALLLGVDRRRFFVWFSVVTVLGFGAATAFWVWVAP